MVECMALDRELGVQSLLMSVCASYLLPNVLVNTQEAVALSQHD